MHVNAFFRLGKKLTTSYARRMFRDIEIVARIGLFVYKNVHRLTLSTPVSPTWHGMLTYLVEVRLFFEASFTLTGYSYSKCNVLRKEKATVA